MRKLGSRGRLLIPAAFRRALGLNEGDSVLFRIVDGELHVRPVREVLGRIQAHLGAYLSSETSLCGELIAERRQASENEL
ncbi:AbrB/MazE/SpoVT family DNA-binding domain-containing protein [Novosphingobium sp. 17-62-19]|uniref:AbrB/MazE/SpoVT family DNA-binding domain-containing protein n=1 Tax=Novosphingobium sp. 17-62-19 TaxID=1970406 RepID=UPI00344B1D1D